MKTPTQPESTALLEEINDDYYREESCPIDGRVRFEGETWLAVRSFAEAKEAVLKRLFNSTNGVITKQDWMWMVGIGSVGAIALSTVRAVWVNAIEPPVHLQDAPAITQDAP